MQDNVLTLDKVLNSLIYGSPFCIIIYTSYSLSKCAVFIGPPCTVLNICHCFILLLLTRPWFLLRLSESSCAHSRHCCTMLLIDVVINRCKIVIKESEETSVHILRKILESAHSERGSTSMYGVAIVLKLPWNLIHLVRMSWYWPLLCHSM